MKLKWLLSLVCMVLVLACGCALAENMPGDVYDLEWYQTAQPETEGAAYLNFFIRYNPVRISHTPGDEGMPYRWNIWYGYENLGSADFTPTQVTEVYFDENGKVADVFVTSGVGLNIFFNDNILKVGDARGYNVIRPAGSDTGYGAAIRGVDANGNELVFGVYVPLSQEVEIRYTIDMLQQPNEREEGKPFIVMTPREAVSPLVVTDQFDKGAGWFYGFLAHNETDLSFTATELVEVLFDFNGDAYPSVYDGEQLTGWGCDLSFATDWDFGSGIPVQDVQSAGYILRGVDAEGNEMSFHTYIELEQPK